MKQKKKKKKQIEHQIPIYKPVIEEKTITEAPPIEDTKNKSLINLIFILLIGLVVAVTYLIITQTQMQKKLNEHLQYIKDNSAPVFYKINQNPQGQEEKPEDKIDPSTPVYKTNEWWTVDKQWKLKIDNITAQPIDKKFHDEEYKQQIIINYTFENLGYTGKSQDLYLYPKIVLDAENGVGIPNPNQNRNYPDPIKVGEVFKGAEDVYYIPSTSESVKIIFKQLRSDTPQEEQAIFEIPLKS